MNLREDQSVASYLKENWFLILLIALLFASICSDGPLVDIQIRYAVEWDSVAVEKEGESP